MSPCLLSSFFNGLVAAVTWVAKQKKFPPPGPRFLEHFFRRFSVTGRGNRYQISGTSVCTRRCVLWRLAVVLIAYVHIVTLLVSEVGRI